MFSYQDLDLDYIVNRNKETAIALETILRLAKIKKLLKESIAEGTGLDRFSAEMYNRTIKIIASPENVDHLYTHAAESFDNIPSRLSNTKYVLEKVDSSLKGAIHRFMVNSDTSLKFFDNIFLNIEKNSMIFNKTIDKLRKDINSTDFSDKSEYLKSGEFVVIKVRNTDDLFDYNNSDEIIEALNTHITASNELGMLNNNVRKKLLPYVEITTHDGVEGKDDIRKILDGNIDIETQIPSNGKSLNGGKFMKLKSNSKSPKDMMVVNYYKLIQRETEESGKLKREKDPRKLLKILDILEENFITKDNDITMDDITIWQHTLDYLFNMNYTMIKENQVFAKKTLEYVNRCVNK